MSTHAAKLDEAKEFQKNFLDSKQGARQQAKTKRSAHKLAEQVVRDLTGSSVVRPAAADIFTKWTGMTPEFADRSARFLSRLFSSLVGWRNQAVAPAPADGW